MQLQTFYDYCNNIESLLARNHEKTNADGAGARARDLETLNPIQRQLAELLNANKTAKLRLEQANDEELQILYNEQQEQEIFLLDILEQLQIMAQGLAELTNAIQHHFIQ